MVLKIVFALLSLFTIGNCIVINGITADFINNNLPSLKTPLGGLLGCEKPFGLITNGYDLDITENTHLCWMFIPVNETHGYACSCSIIGPNTALTAAHCVEAKTAGHPIQIYMMVQDLTQINTDPNVVKRVESSSIINPKYPTQQYDAALVKFDEPIPPQITPITLRKECNLPVKTAVQPQGYGKTTDGSTTVSPIPQTVTTTIMDFGICRMNYLYEIEENIICTCGLDNKNICSGDSGGPLCYLGEQIGINSFGSSLGCQAYQPSGYASICDNYDFIVGNM